MSTLIKRIGAQYKLEQYLVSFQLSVSILCLPAGPQALFQTAPIRSILGQDVLVTVPDAVWPQLPWGRRGKAQIRQLLIGITQLYSQGTTPRLFMFRCDYSHSWYYTGQIWTCQIPGVRQGQPSAGHCLPVNAPTQEGNSFLHFQFIPD